MLIQYRDPRYVAVSMWGYHATISLCGVLALIDGPPSAIGIAGGGTVGMRLAWGSLLLVSGIIGLLSRILARPYAEAVALFGGAVGMVIWVGAIGVAHLEGYEVSEPIVMRFLATVFLSLVAGGARWAYHWQWTHLDPLHLTDTIAELAAEQRREMQRGQDR